MAGESDGAGLDANEEEGNEGNGESTGTDSGTVEAARVEGGMPTDAKRLEASVANGGACPEESRGGSGLAGAGSGSPTRVELKGVVGSWTAMAGTDSVCPLAT